MKTNPRSLWTVAISIGSVLLFAGSATAQITGINTTYSYATNQFNDLNSSGGGGAGGFYTTLNGTLWNGSPMSLNQTDPTTLDYANAVIAASGSGNAYNISVNLNLTQDPANTGYADLTFWFAINYQIGGSGLPSLTTMFPNFLVSGVVDSAAGSYASIQGQLNYYSLNGGYTSLDTVTYNWLNNTPGAFNNIAVSGTAVNGTTPALGAGSQLGVAGYLTFRVDPATFSVESTPEPGTLALAGLGAASLFAFRRRLKA